MGWLASFGAGVITAFATAIVWGWLAYFYTHRYAWSKDISEWVVMGAVLLGLIVGFFLGIAVARIAGGPFRHAMALAVGWPSLGAVAVALLIVIFGTLPATIHGEKLILHVEARFPAGWTPDQIPDQSKTRCDLTPNGDVEQGTIEWDKAAPREDGRWVIPLQFSLRSAYENRHVEIWGLTSKSEPYELWVALPVTFSAKNETWSEWKDWDDKAQTRFRVEPEQQVLAAPKAAVESQRRKQEERFASLTATDPLERWPDVFEPDPGHPPFGALPKAMAAIQTRMAEFPGVLRSGDPTLVRRAVIALAMRRAIDKHKG